MFATFSCLKEDIERENERRKMNDKKEGKKSNNSCKISTLR
jgi:hypothetical protein